MEKWNYKIKIFYEEMIKSQYDHIREYHNCKRNDNEINIIENNKSSELFNILQDKFMEAGIVRMIIDMKKDMEIAMLPNKYQINQNIKEDQRKFKQKMRSICEKLNKDKEFLSYIVSYGGFGSIMNFLLILKRYKIDELMNIIY